MDSKYREKIKTLDELKKVIGEPPRSKKVIMCHGTFDVVHPGHIRHLMYAKSKAEYLVASLTCDAHIEKAHLRPYVPEELRAMNLAALDMVDFVVVDTQPTPLENLANIKPDYFAKGYEYVENGMHPKTEQENEVLESYGGEFIFTPGDIVYSSSALLNLSPPNISGEKLSVLLEAESLTFGDLISATEKLKGFKIHVVGDTIVDSYTQTTMIGSHGKTPTISVQYQGRRDYVGGAGIVAKHLRSAGAEVVFSTVVGDDDYGKFVVDDLTESGIKVNAIIDKTRPTTNKNAIVCGDYRMIKIDTLDNRVISDNILDKLLSATRDIPTNGIVFSDFRHGIFNPETIPDLTDAIPDGVFRVADSQVASRWGNILEFRGFDLITPNEREARFALGDQDSVVRPLALKLFQRSGCRNLFLKLGERGLLGYRKRDREDSLRAFFALDSIADRALDAVGAGDALLAYGTLGLMATGNEIIAAVLGNVAAGLECEHDGNHPITPKDVAERLRRIDRRNNFEPG